MCYPGTVRTKPPTGLAQVYERPATSSIAAGGMASIWSRAPRRHARQAEMDRGNARRNDLCWPALPLSSLASPHPRGRGPTTIPPACLNTPRSTTRQRPFRPGVIILLRVKLMALALRPVSGQTALVTITASGAIRGRNHADAKWSRAPPMSAMTDLQGVSEALLGMGSTPASRSRRR